MATHYTNVNDITRLKLMLIKQENIPLLGETRHESAEFGQAAYTC